MGKLFDSLTPSDFISSLNDVLDNYGEQKIRYFIQEYLQHCKDFGNTTIDNYYNGGWELDKENFNFRDKKREER